MPGPHPGHMPADGMCFHNGATQRLLTPCDVSSRACHESFGRDPVFSHPLVKRFLFGTRRLRTAARATLPQWDLTLVLEALRETPFEPLNQIPLKILSLKTALLLALTTAKRVSDLCALSMRPDCLAINGDLSRAVLRLNPAVMPKVNKSSYRSQTVVLWAFSPPFSCGEERLHCLCPVHRTAMVRSSPQLFVCHDASTLGRQLSKQQRSHWFCEGIEAAYEAAGRPHSWSSGVYGPFQRNRGRGYLCSSVLVVTISSYLILPVRHVV